MNKNEQDNANAASNYRVSDATAEYMLCLQELNNLTEHIANAAQMYDCRDLDETMQPIVDAVTNLQDTIITTLIAESIRISANAQHITEV